MLYAEDLSPGIEFAFSHWTVTEEEIVAFGRQWDPLPMHSDPVAARDSPFGGLIASGLHTAAIYQRLAVEAWWSNLAVVAGRGFEQLRLWRPVPPGTVLTGGVRLAEVTPRPDRGDAVIVVHGRLVDDEDREVLTVIVDAVVASRG